MVSDGVESCGGDPISVMTELRASGLDVVLHTVGLGVKGDEATALEALATAGGGMYFDAPTGSELLVGISAAVRFSSEFVLQSDLVNQFPRDVVRVQGGSTVSGSEVLELGTYSFENHLFKEKRFFSVSGTPGEKITLRFRHLFSIHLNVTVMHPVINKSNTCCCFRLGYLIFMVRELKVYTAGMNIEAVSKTLH